MRLRSAFLLQVLAATAPALILLLSIPLVRLQLDLEHFAGFTVVISATGLLAALDGGLGRASTYFISLSLNQGSRRRVVTEFQSILAVGLLFSLLLGISAALVVQTAHGQAFDTARPALVVLAGFTPVFIACSLLRGFLEAEQRFGTSSTQQLVHGIAVGIAPVLLFSASTNLSLFAWIVGMGRLILAFALLHSAGLANRSSWFVSQSILTHVRRIISYTKWLFLSNAIGLTIVFADRFIVASHFSSADVAAYVLPMEMIARLQILISAFCTVLFPRLVASSKQEKTQMSDHLRFVTDAKGAVMAATAVVGFIAAFVAAPVMQWWIGEALAHLGARVLIIGIVGVGLIANSALAMLEINSRGQTRPVAYLHVVELPLYIFLLYIAARWSSVDLLLAIWIFRLSIDAVGMNLIAAKGIARSDPKIRIASPRRVVPWGLVMASFVLLSAMGFASSMLSLPFQLAIALVGVTAAVAGGRHFVARLHLSIQSVR